MLLESIGNSVIEHGRKCQGLPSSAKLRKKSLAILLLKRQEQSFLSFNVNVMS